MPRPNWNGRRVTNAIRWVIARDHAQCWLCQHHITPQAKSLDHILTASTHPQLEWEPTNWKAAHLASAGHPKGCQHPDCQCPGNTGRRDQPWTAPPTRQW